MTPKVTDKVRINSLAMLIKACNAHGVEIRELALVQNGFLVRFEGISGDAALHDATYGNITGEWETLMPWDYEDVSVHGPVRLAQMISAYLKGEDWTVYDKEE